MNTFHIESFTVKAILPANTVKFLAVLSLKNPKSPFDKASVILNVAEMLVINVAGFRIKVPSDDLSGFASAHQRRGVAAIKLHIL